MLRSITLQLLKRFGMTAATQLRLHLALFVLDVTRAVGLVTFITFRIGHGLSMACMAVETAVRFPVFCMTFHAVHLCMHTRMLLHLFTRLRMTGQAYRLHRRNGIHLHLHGCMGVVTRGTLSYTVVRRSIRCMALCTCGDNSAFRRRMIRMAITACDILSMRTTGTRQCFNLWRMTRGTLIHRCSVAPTVVGGLVWCMTSDAVCVNHLGAMRFMTLHTLHELSCSSTVFQVTIGTCHMRMGTGYGIKIFPYVLMAGKAYCGDVIAYRRERSNPRGMRGMAARTVVQSIVFLSGGGMALGTPRDNRL